MRILHNSYTRREFCAKCNHKLSKHDLTTMYGRKTIDAKCEVCKCDGKLSIA